MSQSVKRYLVKTFRISIFVGIIASLLFSCLPAVNSRAADFPIGTDYYNGSINPNGTLNLFNKITGSAVVKNTANFFLNYGNITTLDVSPINPSFEVDANSDGIPDGWTVDKTSIRQSADRASQGTKSLKFNMTATDTSHRRAYSSLIPCSPAMTYNFSIDSFYSSFTSGEWSAYVFPIYFATTDGSGDATLAATYAQVPAVLGSWNNISFGWKPPAEARSFQILLYVDMNEKSNLYFDNIKITQTGVNTDISPANPSFETDTNSDGIPDAWTVDKTYIRQSSTFAIQGTKSLRFNMTAQDTSHRRAYSSLVQCSPGKTYNISLDSYYNSFTSGSWFANIYLLYYTASDGTGSAVLADSSGQVPAVLGTWNSINFSWSPPAGARSFQVLIYVDMNEVSSLYFDNVNITQIGVNSDISPANPSFELDANSDGIPDGWTVDNTSIRQSADRASQGSRSLKFNMTAQDTSHRRAYSPLITCSPDQTININADSFYSSFTSGGQFVVVYLVYYTTADGSGNATLGDTYSRIPTVLGSWNTTSYNWTSPAAAKSFRLLLYADASEVSTVYFDNIKVSLVGSNYETNGSNITSTLTTVGNNITIQSVDDSNPEVTVANRYDLNAHSPNITYTATLTYKQSVPVTEERFDFVVPTQAGLVMTRDLQLVSNDFSQIYYSDMSTPKVIKFNNGLSFLGNDTMGSMQLAASGANSQVSFFADAYLDHPFSYYVKNGGGSAVDISSQKRSSGSSYSASVTFSINTSTTPKVLIKTRQPNGYDATLVLTNHADDETLARASAVAFGTEDNTSPAYGTKGILGRGISWTKSVFVSGQVAPYSDLSNTAYKSLTDRMALNGAEIIAHTITPITESRSVVDSGMQTLSQYSARDWIDHGGTTGLDNFEDLASQGTIKGDTNYSLDLFDKYNYKYAWSYKDFTQDNRSLNILAPETLEKKTPFFYYNNNVDDNPADSKKIYLWSTTNTLKSPDLYYTGSNIDTLIAQRGIHIGHEYLAHASCENHTWYINTSTGKSEIFPAFDAELTYMASKKAAGLLWTPTLAQFADYLVGLSGISITTNPDGTYTVKNNNLTTVSGLTLMSESPISSVTLNGVPLSTYGGSYGANELVIPSLSAGNSAIIAIVFGTSAMQAVTTSTITDVNITEATLNAEVTNMGTAHNVSVSFQWGTVSGKYPHETRPQVITRTGKVKVNLSGLAANTMYCVRAKLAGNGTAYGKEIKFMTQNRKTPKVITQAATRIDGKQATLNGAVTELGSAAPVRVYFEWGTTPRYGNTTPAQNLRSPGKFDRPLGGLNRHTTYHYRAVAVGDGITYGADMTFTTY